VVDPEDRVSIATAVRAMAADPARRAAMAAASLAIDREWPLQRSVDAFAQAVAMAARAST
ncbi:MAG: glycosyltransferase family 1 protein, partial [Solirubrobacterales bacterium]